jgi:hypothetical protein
MNQCRKPASDGRALSSPAFRETPSMTIASMRTPSATTPDMTTSSMTTSNINMKRSADPRRGFVRCLSLAAATLLLLAAAPGQRAEAMSPISPAMAPTANAASGGLVTEVRGGHGGGGGHMGGGFHGGGGGWHGGGMHVGGFHGGGFHGGRAFHGGGFHHGSFRFAHHHRHFIGGYYYPSYYPYYYHPRCRVVWTHYGPRRICYHRHWHWRHHWHHRHYW